MKAKIFISYSEFDKNKLRAIQNAMKKRDGLDPIIVSERCEVGKNLTDKVKQCIYEADCLMPILTRKSISSQWVNQEIGFAKALERPIIPLVESSLLDELKGFIHKQIDLPFKFIGAESDSQKEARNFRKCYKSALEYIIESSQITPTHRAKRGKLRITKPTETYVSSEYVEVSGINAKPGSAIIVITSLYGKHLAPQKGYAIADNLGNWKYDRCHLFNINKDRIVYAIAVDLVYEQSVRELLAEHRKPPRENAIDLFQQILKNEQIPFEISPGKKLVRRSLFSAVTVPRVDPKIPRISVRSSEGHPIKGATVVAIAENNTTKSGKTNDEGIVELVIATKRAYKLLIAHPEHPGAIIHAWDTSKDTNITLTVMENTGSVICMSTGYIPGLSGRLNPILDTSDRTYLYADNIAIDGGKNQPATFRVDVPFKLEDPDGVVMQVRVLHIQGCTSLLQYVRM